MRSQDTAIVSEAGKVVAGLSGDARKVAVTQLQRRINSAIKVEGGPLLSLDADGQNLTIKHCIPVDAKAAFGYAQMRKEELPPNVFYKVDGKEVFLIHANDETGLHTYAMQNPGNLPAGMDVLRYAQHQVDGTRRQNGERGPIEFPMWDKTVKTKIDGLIGLSSVQRLAIKDAQMVAQHQANEKGFESSEAQAFAMGKGFDIGAVETHRRLNGPMIVVHTTNEPQQRRVFMGTTINYEDMKRPTIEALK